MNGRPRNPHDRFTFYQVHLHTGHDAASIALNWGLESPQALFHLLRQDGFPVCEHCAHSKGGLCDACRDKCKHKARRGKKAKDLPTADNASDLFIRTAVRLMNLARAASHHVEAYGSKRFEKADVYSLSGGVTLWRDTMPEQDWRTICEEHGQDPEQSSFVLKASKARNPAGIDASPRETALIAAFLLLEGPQEESAEQKTGALLQKLHPKPEKADLQKLLYGNPNNPKVHPGKVEELRRVARQVARLVRGAPIGGSPAPGLTVEDQSVGWYITDRIRSGEPYDSVRQRLVSLGHEGSKVDFLKGLGLSSPD